MVVASKCAWHVFLLIEAHVEGKTDRVNEIRCVINDLEHEADNIKNTLRAHLPKSLLMPVDRRDLLEILEIQDDIADTSEDIAALFSLRPFPVHEEMREQLLTLTRRCTDASEHAAKIINTLDELVETGFGGRQSDLVNEMVDELNRIESDTDQIGTDLLKKLFSLEDEMSPVSVMLWYELIAKISNIADLSEKVGNRLRLLLAR